jgi:YD repeat-containing protein
MTLFDETGAPLIATRIGTAKRRWTYDAAGRVVERSDYDTNGKPLQNAYGYASVRYSYDEYGRERGRELLDIRGQTLQFNVSVDRITPGSVAVDASLRVGDVILSYDGEAVSTSHQFTNILERLKGDRARELGIRRGEQTLSVDLPPGRLRGLELTERVIGTK